MEFRDLRNELNKERWASPFAPFALSEAEKKQLRQLSTDLVELSIEEYEDFTFVQGGRLMERDWKFLRRDHQCDTFVRRREKYGLNGFGTKKRFRRESDTTASTSSTQSEDITSLDVADYRSVGVTNGTKEDAVYGVMNPTTITMRIKSAYVDDKIEDCNVFSVLEGPTPEEPFRTLSIRWRVTENPPVFNLLVKSYDHVYLESTGVVTLTNGEEVTFQLLHSIDFPRATPAVPQFSRGQVAGIAFWRQVDDNLVSIWARGVFSVPFERARTLFVPIIGAAMSKSVMNNFHCAQMRKLRWAVHRRRWERRQNQRLGPQGGDDDFSRPAIERSDSSASFSSRGGFDDASSNKVCVVCTRKRTLRSGVKCDLCAEHVCGPCCITHKVAVVGFDNKLRWHKIRVCSFCMAKVVKMDAGEAIRIELAAGEYDRIN